MPYFCPVTMFLLYLDVCNISDSNGYVFPDRVSLVKLANRECDHSTSTNKMLYNGYLHHLKKFITKVCPRAVKGEAGTIGTHTLRYFGYLLATWSILKRMNESERGASKVRSVEASAGKPVSVLPDINTAEVQLGARHASHQSAIIYVNLAATLFWEWDDLDPLERKRHDIPNWKSIFLGYELYTRLTDYQGGRKLPLP